VSLTVQREERHTVRDHRGRTRDDRVLVRLSPTADQIFAIANRYRPDDAARWMAQMRRRAATPAVLTSSAALAER
jgi:hypothetical protein